MRTAPNLGTEAVIIRYQLNEAIVVFIACHSCHVIIVVSNNCTHRDACALDSLKLERGKADVKQNGRKSSNLIKKKLFHEAKF